MTFEEFYKENGELMYDLFKHREALNPGDEMLSREMFKSALGYAYLAGQESKLDLLQKQAG